jgi:hypothetical protein
MVVSVVLRLLVTFSGLAKVANFITNVDAENQTLINHKCVCGALNRHFCTVRVRCWRSCPMSFVLVIFRFSFCCRPYITFGNFQHLSVRLNAKVLCGRLPFRLVQIFHRTLHKLLFVFRMLLVSDCL